MTERDFIPKEYSGKLEKGKITCQSPSNIALVKYWGKKANQVPANPSLSFTLDVCKTTTALSYEQKNKASSVMDFELYFEQEKNESFRPKIQQFFDRVAQYLPFLRDVSIVIETSNSFPHSSGIASSASGFGALSLCLMNMERILNPQMTREYFLRKASFLARLGSGSACRSIDGEIVVWGHQAHISGSSDLFGIKYPYEVHPNFRNYQDTILLVDKGEKQVSSSLGHNLMKNHSFAEQRFEQAHDNIDQLKKIFGSGDLPAFIQLVESEALTLHAMMMTSRPYFLLMKPNTLAIINKVFQFRENTGLHLCFTLDAGANVHLLYPENEKVETMDFIKDELVAYCEKGQYICDRIGKGSNWE